METFRWPQGARADLSVYPKDHPQRQPAEEYFANNVRGVIYDVRNGGTVNLWVLVCSLKNLRDSNDSPRFDTWLWAIDAVLGGDTCREIGERVCKEEGFTLEE